MTDTLPTTATPSTFAPVVVPSAPPVSPAIRPDDVDAYFSTLDRVDQTLEEVAELSEQLKDDYPVSPDLPLPPNFLLSVVIPVYNEERTILRVVERVAALPIPKEIIIVDDHSTDGTRERLWEIENQPGIRLVRHPRNRGKGAALRTGFGLAQGEVVVVQDADLEYDPREIPRLLRPLLLNKAEVVFGSRYLAVEMHDSSVIHRLGNRLLTAFSNCFTGLRLSDMETCYKLFRRDALQQISLEQDRFGCEPELTAKIARRGLKVVELPIGYKARSYAQGKKIGIRDLFQTLYCIVRYGLWD